MVEKKEVIKEEEISKVKAYNIKIKNIEKVDRIGNEEENGNSSRAINKIIEAYK
jgi:hypothetical protein